MDSRFTKPRNSLFRMNDIQNGEGRRSRHKRVRARSISPSGRPQRVVSSQERRWVSNANLCHDVGFPAADGYESRYAWPASSAAEHRPEAVALDADRVRATEHGPNGGIVDTLNHANAGVPGRVGTGRGVRFLQKLRTKSLGAGDSVDDPLRTSSHALSCVIRSIQPPQSW